MTVWRWFGRGLLGLFLAALLAVLPAACRNEEQGAELSGEIGPGSGGPPVVQARVMTVLLATPDCQTIGTLAFDSGYFTRTFPAGAANEIPFVCEITSEAVDEIHYVYQNTAEAVTVIISRISGRPDTPCRFNAALLARDEGFAILASGDVFNAAGLEFHQVNLTREATFQRFHCTELRSNVGIQISSTSTGGDKLGSEQLHFLLNSVSN